MCLAMVNPYCTLCQVDFCSFAVFMSESSALLSLFIAMRLWRCGYFLLYISFFFFLLTKIKVNIRPGAQRALWRGLLWAFDLRLRRSEEPRPSSRFYCNLQLLVLCSPAGSGALSFFSQRFCLPRFFLHNTRTHTRTKQKKPKSFI